MRSIYFIHNRRHLRLVILVMIIFLGLSLPGCKALGYINYVTDPGVKDSVTFSEYWGDEKPGYASDDTADYSGGDGSSQNRILCEYFPRIPHANNADTWTS